MSYRTIPANRLAKLFAHSIAVFGDHWIWLGAQTWNGYGLAPYKGHGTTAHRVVYQLMGGAIPEGLDLGHTCGVKLCVNPGARQTDDAIGKPISKSKRQRLQERTRI